MIVSKMRKLRSGVSGWACVVVLSVSLVLALIVGSLGFSDNPARAAAPGPTRPEIMSIETINSIDRGLKYLARTQRNNGSWFNQGGHGTYPAVMTSLAGLALMAGGSTPETGPYARNVTKAMNFILRLAESRTDGLIVGPGGEGRSMYGHGFSMLFLAQCYGMEIREKTQNKIRKVLNRAVVLTVRAQSDRGARANHAGGWIYTPSGRSDEGSVTVTQLQALRACRNVGINVPMQTIARAVAYLKYCQRSDGGICYSASSRSNSRPAISAAAIACFYATGLYDKDAGGRGAEAEMVGKLVSYVIRTVKIGGRSRGAWGHYFYMHYYMAQAMYQRGGKYWEKTYYPGICKDLLKRQATDGSWNGDSVGTVYGTAIATTILQLPYGYLPIYEK